MIQALAAIVKANKGFILILVIFVFAGMSLISSMLTDNNATSNRTGTPVSAPTQTASPIKTEEPVEQSQEAPQEIIQSDEIDQLLIDAAADAAMAIVSFGFETNYEISPEDRLAILRPMVSEELLALFESYYSKEDWNRVVREKVQIFPEILEVNFIPEITTGDVIVEVVVSYLDERQKPVKSGKPEIFRVVLERTYEFTAWRGKEINFN